MLKVEPKTFVFTEFLKNNLGFTYTNFLLHMLIFTISLPVLLFGLAKIKVIPSEESLMIHQLFFMLQNDVYTATDVIYEDDRLYFYLDTGEIAFIEKYQDTLRRRVERKGHEIYARNIQTFSLQSVPYGVIVTIETTKGGVYKRTLVTIP